MKLFRSLFLVFVLSFFPLFSFSSKAYATASTCSVTASTHTLYNANNQTIDFTYTFDEPLITGEYIGIQHSYGDLFLNSWTTGSPFVASGGEPAMVLTASGTTPTTVVTHLNLNATYPGVSDFLAGLVTYVGNVPCTGDLSYTILNSGVPTPTPTISSAMYDPTVSATVSAMLSNFAQSNQDKLVLLINAVTVVVITVAVIFVTIRWFRSIAGFF